MKETRNYFFATLENVYPTHEINSLFSITCSHVLKCSANFLLINRKLEATEIEKNKIVDIANRLKNNEPIQYILGYTEFYGLKICVSPQVLIPRNETEELVDLIVKRNKKESPKILDLCTGSGCIAIALETNIPKSTVWAIDVSEKALMIAKGNAKLNKADITFYQYDILLQNNFNESNFDIIVSNPPYVTEAEKILMHKNVLEHEPHLALFVPNTDPLIFYRTIIENFKTNLGFNGEFYFEINEAYGQLVAGLMEKNDFSADIINDINGKNRIAYGKRTK